MILGGKSKADKGAATGKPFKVYHLSLLWETNSIGLFVTKRDIVAVWEVTQTNSARHGWKDDVSEKKALILGL